MVIMGVIIYSFTSIIRPKVVYHKKSVDLVTGNFLSQVVVLLGNLTSEALGSFQSRLIGGEGFCMNNVHIINAT